jgi:protein-disulfide isomerase
VLGRASAPVTLVEYADLQCPYCAEWAHRTLPVVLSDYVRTGKIRLVFRGLAFLGPDSHFALQTAIAAGRHGRLWDIVDGLYARQGPENSGWITDELLDKIVSAAGLDSGRIAAERDELSVHRQIQQTANAATVARVSGTPTFELGRTGRPLRLVRLQSLGPEGILPAINALLRS